MYASSNDNVGVDEGSNSITLTTAQLPVHSHTFSGNNISGYCSADRLGIGADKVSQGGCLSITTRYDGNAGSAAYASGAHNMAQINFSATPSGTVGDTGSGAAIDIKGAVRRVYIYYRQS